MKKDIIKQKADRLSMAIVPLDENYNDPWDIYIINHFDKPMLGVLINSKGYDLDDPDNPIRTSTLRYFYEEVPPQTALKIELLPQDLHKINNEYWVSFKIDDYMYDRKFVFVKGSVEQSFLTNVPIINAPGIYIK